MNITTLAILASLATPALPPQTASTTSALTTTPTTAPLTKTSTTSPLSIEDDATPNGCARAWPACQAAGAVVGAVPGAAVGAGAGVVGAFGTIVVAAAEGFQGPASSTIGFLGGDFLPFVGICAAGGAVVGLAGGAVAGWVIADDVVE